LFCCTHYLEAVEGAASMSASFKSLYIYFAGPITFVGLMLLTSGLAVKTGASLFAVGLGWHLACDWGRN
jgi:hypothetical protein